MQDKQLESEKIEARPRKTFRWAVLIAVTLIAVLVIIGWLLVPEWRSISGGLLAFASSIASLISSAIKAIGDHDESKGKDVSAWIPKAVKPQALQKAGTISLVLSLLAMIIGGFFFWRALRDSSLMGKTVSNENFLANYGLMYMGDTGDIQFSKMPGGMGFLYQTNGKGPHEWEYKYLNGKENPDPAQFSGIMLADGAWGNKANDGYDLRGYKEINWKACVEEGSDVNSNGNVVVEFVAGGIDWRINDAEMTREPVPFPDSLPRQSLGIYALRKCPETELMSFSLSEMPPAYLQKVIGGFGWVVSWAPNGVTRSSDGTASTESRTFKIIISEVRYIKDNSISAFLGRNSEVIVIALLVLILVSIVLMTTIAQKKPGS